WKKAVSHSCRAQPAARCRLRNRTTLGGCRGCVRTLSLTLRISSSQKSVRIRERALVFLIVSGAVWFVREQRAYACGASGGGVAGVEACTIEGQEEEIRPKVRVGAGVAYTRTTLRFSGDQRLDEGRLLSIGTIDFRPTSRVSLRLG